MAQTTARRRETALDETSHIELPPGPIGEVSPPQVGYRLYRECEEDIQYQAGIVKAKATACCSVIGGICLLELHKAISLIGEPIEVRSVVIPFWVIGLTGIVHALVIYALVIWHYSILRHRDLLNKFLNHSSMADSKTFLENFPRRYYRVNSLNSLFRLR